MAKIICRVCLMSVHLNCSTNRNVEMVWFFSVDWVVKLRLYDLFICFFFLSSFLVVLIPGVLCDYE